MAITVVDLEPYLDALNASPNPNLTNYWAPLVKLFPDGVAADALLQDYTQRAEIAALGATQIQFAAASATLARRPVRCCKDSRFAVIDTYPTALTITGAVGTKYVYLDLGVSTVTFAQSTTAPESETTRWRLPLGEVAWNGTAITNVTAYAYNRELGASTGATITGEYRNLEIVHDVASPTSKVVITADVIDVQGVRLTSVSVTADLTVAGANGLDTGAEASSTHYYLWLILKSLDGTRAALWSVSSTSPTMPAGYDLKRLVGHRRNDGSSNLIRGTQANDIVLLDNDSTQIAVSISDSADMDCSNFVTAAIARHVLLNVEVTSAGPAIWRVDDKDDSTLRYFRAVNGGSAQCWARKNDSNLIRATKVSGTETFSAWIAAYRLKVL